MYFYILSAISDGKIIDLNCMSAAAFLEMTAVLRWFDIEPSLSVAVITGAGKKAFCTGADLKEWYANVQEAIKAGKDTSGLGPGSVAGSEALSNRRGKKPIIAAVNGMALGGGFEAVVNCDLVIASETATFGLVEIKRGLAAFAGAMPRLIRIVGLQRASELALTGNIIDASTAKQWGLVNRIVPQEQVVDEAVKWARDIAENSLDSIICTRAGLRQGWSAADVVDATKITNDSHWKELQRGENMKEGLHAFHERRSPRWVRSRL